MEDNKAHHQSNGNLPMYAHIRQTQSPVKKIKLKSSFWCSREKNNATCLPMWTCGPLDTNRRSNFFECIETTYRSQSCVHVYVKSIVSFIVVVRSHLVLVKFHLVTKLLHNELLKKPKQVAVNGLLSRICTEKKKTETGAPHHSRAKTQK